ncbi:hypothetical protein I7I50_02293 [Histoplasma capsulatum G186AR]|uniref:Uncharacterized protein n=1 Tax=Ajellomyces capsulatus TaxID=5037 RepID=A0A8H7Z3F9_AJECA|nr:hypothetical protein I7I52_01043 [Histoplasma capsulatum]QSS71456.1 hypothetical protein I7I50_02293 [Histoplasma capsulatum G186AR]
MDKPYQSPPNLFHSGLYFAGACGFSCTLIFRTIEIFFATRSGFNFVPLYLRGFDFDPDSCSGRDLLELDSQHFPICLCYLTVVV